MLYGVAAIYGVLSVITFIAYQRDKSASLRGRWRIKERSLHLLELLGGWPGGLLARRFLRHKSSKLSFRAVSWLIIALHVLAIGVWAWSGAAGNLKS